MEVLKVDEWLRIDKPRYRLMHMGGKTCAQRLKDSEVFCIGQNVFRYNLPCTITSWMDDCIIVWVKAKNLKYSFYTNIDTLSINPR